MRRLTLSTLGFLGSTVPGRAFTQVIDYTQVRQYVGEDVTVEGPVARVERVQGGRLKFSIGKTYSRRTLEVFVPAEFVTAFDQNLRGYEGKTVEVRGRITTGEAEGIAPGAGAGTSSIPAIILVDSGRLLVKPPSVEKKPPPAA